MGASLASADATSVVPVRGRRHRVVYETATSSSEGFDAEINRSLEQKQSCLSVSWSPVLPTARHPLDPNKDQVRLDEGLSGAFWALFWVEGA